VISAWQHSAFWIVIWVDVKAIELGVDRKIIVTYIENGDRGFFIYILEVMAWTQMVVDSA